MFTRMSLKESITCVEQGPILLNYVLLYKNDVTYPVSLIIER